jgi:hypothetical protein
MSPGLEATSHIDKGPQFIAADFKPYLRRTGMTHLRTAPYDPQFNGKIEQLYKSIKGPALRPRAPSTAIEAWPVFTGFVHNTSPRQTASPVAPSRSETRGSTSPASAAPTGARQFGWPKADMLTLSLSVCQRIVDRPAQDLDIFAGLKPHEEVHLLAALHRQRAGPRLSP